MIMPQIHNSFLLWITNCFSCYIWNCCLQNLEAACSILLCSPQLQVFIIPRKALQLISNVFQCYSVPIITTDVVYQVSLAVSSVHLLPRASGVCIEDTSLVVSQVEVTVPLQTQLLGTWQFTERSSPSFLTTFKQRNFPIHLPLFFPALWIYFPGVTAACVSHNHMEKPS